MCPSQVELPQQPLLAGVCNPAGRRLASIWFCCSCRDLTALLEGGEALAGPALLGQFISQGLKV